MLECRVYGLADLIFNKGVWWVDDMFPALKKRGVFWLELPMTLSILVGLGLDYDVSLRSSLPVPIDPDRFCCLPPIIRCSCSPA
jgi:hypothetical protein